MILIYNRFVYLKFLLHDYVHILHILLSKCCVIIKTCYLRKYNVNHGIIHRLFKIWCKPSNDFFWLQNSKADIKGYGLGLWFSTRKSLARIKLSFLNTDCPLKDSDVCIERTLSKVWQSSEKWLFDIGPRLLHKITNRF